jgi:hypothetical protein
MHVLLGRPIIRSPHSVLLTPSCRGPRPPFDAPVSAALVLSESSGHPSKPKFSGLSSPLCLAALSYASAASCLVSKVPRLSFLLS